MACWILASQDTTHRKSTTNSIRLSGYHVPAVRHRDRFYAKLEDERMKGIGADPEIQ